MSILSGYIKERMYKMTADGFKKSSRDTQSETVFMASGVTLEEALNGKQIKVLTESEYNNLSATEKNNNSIIYFYY